MTLSIFDISKQNILTVDPNNPRFSVTAGEVRSRGVEIDFSGQLSPHWQVIASASRLNATVRRDNNLAEGKPLLGAATPCPRPSSSAWGIAARPWYTMMGN